MKILAFIGANSTEQARIVRQMAQQIAPSYQVKRLRLDRFSSIARRRTADLRRHCATAIPSDAVLTVMGVTSVEEFNVLTRNKALFCVLPGQLPRLLTAHDIKIDDRFIFVTGSPQTLETPEKRRMFCDPESAFSRVLVDEIRRKGAPAEVIEKWS